MPPAGSVVLLPSRMKNGSRVAGLGLAPPALRERSQSQRYDRFVSRLRRSLLDSADSYPPSAPENRLTEIFAEVLRTSPDLLCWLVCKAFKSEVDGDDAKALSVYSKYQVDTQFSLSGGAERPDMQISLQAGTATSRDLFYIENKFGAAATAAQANDYPATGTRPVIVIVPEGQSWPRESRFVRLTWNDVARQIDRLGQEGTAHGERTMARLRYGPICPEPISDARGVRSLSRGTRCDRRAPAHHCRSGHTPPTSWTYTSAGTSSCTSSKAGCGEAPGLRKQAVRFGELGELAWELWLKASWPALERHWREQGYEFDELGGKLIMAPQMSWAG